MKMHDHEIDVYELLEKIRLLQQDLKHMTEARDGLHHALNEANKIIAWQRDEKPDLARMARLEKALSAFVNWTTDEKGVKALVDDDQLWAQAEAALAK